jgi:hypothetical protein
LVGLTDPFWLLIGTAPPYKLNQHGYFDWQVTVAGRHIVTRVTAEDLREYASWDVSIIWRYFPSATDVLTIHGMVDKVVPPYALFHPLPESLVLIINRYDATMYARALGARSPGTHTLHFIEYGDHNFTKVRVCRHIWHLSQKSDLFCSIKGKSLMPFSSGGKKGRAAN